MSDGDDYVPRTGVVLALEHLFYFERAMSDYDVTINELEKLMRVGIADGHDSLALALGMAQIALISSHDEPTNAQ